MSHKRACYTSFGDLLLDLEKLKRNTEGIWGQAVSAKEKTMLEHHRLKSDPRLNPTLFTQDARYQKGRALIAFKDRDAVQSREEADFLYYRKLMSNKYAGGSDSDRKKPLMFLTRDNLSNHDVKRVIAKFSRDFGSTPLEHEKVARKSKLSMTNNEFRSQFSKSQWRKEVNDFVLGRFGKIYSTQHTKKKAVIALSSVRSEPGSPSFESTMKSSPRFTAQSQHHLSPRRDTEALNIKNEIKRSRKHMVDLKLSMGYSELRNIEKMKLKSAARNPYN